MKFNQLYENAIKEGSSKYSAAFHALNIMTEGKCKKWNKDKLKEALSRLVTIHETKKSLVEKSSVSYESEYEDGIPLAVTNDGIYFFRFSKSRNYFSFTGYTLYPYSEEQAREWESDSIGFEAEWYWNDVFQMGVKFNSKYSGVEWNSIPSDAQEKLIDQMIDLMVDSKIEGRSGDFTYTVDGQDTDYYLDAISFGQSKLKGSFYPIAPREDIRLFMAAWDRFHLKKISIEDLQGEDLELINRVKDRFTELYTNQKDELLNKALDVYQSRYFDEAKFDQFMKDKQPELVDPNQTSLKFNEGQDPCWKGYKQYGMKTKNGKKVPNCIKESKLDAVIDDEYGIGYLGESKNLNDSYSPIEDSILSEAKEHRSKQDIAESMRDKLSNNLKRLMNTDHNRQIKVNENYNGWSNRETWNVALNIENDEGLYRSAVDFMENYDGDNPYRDFIQFMGLADSRTSDNVHYLDNKLDMGELNSVMYDLN